MGGRTGEGCTYVRGRALFGPGEDCESHREVSGLGNGRAEYFQDCGDGGRKTSSVEDEGVDLTKTLFDLAIKAVMLAGEGPV